MPKIKTLKVKTFEDACKALGLNSQLVPDFSNVPAKHQTALIAHYKLVIIVEALNGGWAPNWNDDNEYKYYPWFDMEKEKNNPSGFRLGDVYGYSTTSSVGSRLCFKSRELAEYCVKQFIDLYREYFMIS